MDVKKMKLRENAGVTNYSLVGDKRWSDTKTLLSLRYLPAFLVLDIQSQNRNAVQQ